MGICRRNCADCRRYRTRFGSTADRTGWLVLLGTNDLMAGHARSLSALKQDLCRLAQTAKTQVDQVLLIAPPRILDSVDPDWGFPADVAQTSLEMTGVCRQAAAACGCRFLDGSQLEVDRRDGLHLSPAGHEALATSRGRPHPSIMCIEKDVSIDCRRRLLLVYSSSPFLSFLM
jgi:lysophospholipase L1-like esterase